MKLKKLLLLCCLFFSSHSYAAILFDFNITNAPYGGYHLSTTWGDYFIVPNGNEVWIGTENEYNHEHVVAVSRENGFREFTPNSFVSTGLASATVGTNQIASISTEIMFGAGPDKKMHRPSKSADSEYVSVVWQQREKGFIQAQIFDKDRTQLVRPYRCFATSVFHICEFIVPSADLSDKGAFLFASKGVKPAFVPIESLAKSNYEMLADKYKPTGGSRFAISDEDRATLKRLHLIDNQVPTDIPKPDYVTEIPNEPKKKGCIDGDGNLTLAQARSIKIGQKIEEIRCKVGWESGTATYADSNLIDESWSIRGGKRVTVRTDNGVVIEKYVGK